MQRLSLGHATAYGDCVQLYGAFIWGLARRHSRSVADAEDATQEIFLSLWQNAGRFDPSQGSERAFVATLARRRLIDGLRRQYARATLSHVSFEEAEPTPISDERLPAYHDPCDGELALAALEGLRPQYRRALELTFGAGLTQAEVATRLSMPLGSVKSCIRRGLLEVRSALAGRQAAGDARRSAPPANARRGRSRATPPLELEPLLAAADVL